MTDPTRKLARNLLISGAILLAALVAASAQAADGGRQFLPLGQSSAASSARIASSGGHFIPLGSASRRTVRAEMMPLHGGTGGKVWKLKDLRDTPRIPKAEQVPDAVKLAMATGRMPDPYGKGGLPLTGEDREKIAAALAPVFAAKRADEAESLETDLEMPDAVAAGVTGGLLETAQKGLSFVWPVADAHYTISSPFGPRRHPVTGKQDFHAGIDIPAPRGTPVLASADGEVTAVGEHPRLGRYVKLTHADGSYSLYGHLSRWMTKAGRHVRAGDRIGLVGSTGRSTGPHLDFSIRKDGKPFNPMTVLAGALEEKKLAFAR